MTTGFSSPKSSRDFRETGPSFKRNCGVMSVGKRKHENLMSNNLTIVKFSPLRDAKLTIPLFTLRRRSERKANARQRSTRQWLQTTSFPGSLFFLPLQGREEERPWERGCCILTGFQFGKNATGSANFPPYRLVAPLCQVSVLLFSKIRK